MIRLNNIFLSQGSNTMKNRFLFFFYLSIIIFLTFDSLCFAQSFSWAKNAGGLDDDFGLCISTDINGNSYVTGYFEGMATFGTIQLVSYGGYDIFIAKYDESGNCIWAKSAGGTSSESGLAISADTNGNAYVTGHFDGTATFGTIQLVSYGGFDIFIAKYDANGNCVWAKSAGGISSDNGFAISTDANGNLYVTGDFEETATFGTIQLVSNGTLDIFIAKYDANGNCIWAKSAGGNQWETGYGIVTDANGNSNITGYFRGTATFGSIPLESNGDFDIFIAKYDTNGNCVWAKNAGGNDYDGGRGISTDINGNSYVTGYFGGTATFGTIQLISYGEWDIFVAKYDANGNCIWTKNAGGITYDVSYSISTDANGNSYITGYFGGTATFGTIQLISYGEWDIFIAKYDANGNCVWAIDGGGPSSASSQGISIDAIGNAYVTGTFDSTATFGTTQLVSNGKVDIFIASIDNVSSSGELLSSDNISSEIQLYQNYPNPFNPSTTIQYQIPELSFVTLKVYDVLGNEIEALVNEEKTIGSYEVEFDASRLPSGVYFF